MEYIRINDVSSWINYGKKRGYDKFLIKEELKRITDLMVGEEKKMIWHEKEQVGTSCDTDKGWNNHRQHCIDIIEKELINI